MLEHSLFDLLSEKIIDAAQYVRGIRKNAALSDVSFVMAGISRVLSKSNSGREWLQCDPNFNIGRSTFFDALASKRRKQISEQLSEKFTQQLRTSMRVAGVDFLAEIPKLSDVEVIAVDGHEIAHPQHAATNEKGRFTTMKMIYGMDLHTGTTKPLCRVGKDGLKAHEWPEFKRLLSAQIKAREVHSPIFYVLDRAYIDIAFWQKMLKKNVFMLTRYKENMNPMMKQPVDFDQDDPRNQGVDGCYLLGFDGKGMAYLIEYTDPETGTEYRFITTATQLLPGELAWLYLCRWRIEKAFDTFENDLEEDKAWATGNTAV